MPRKRRKWVPYAYHHIYSRGNNKQKIFHDEMDVSFAFRIFSMLHEESPISICSFCFMTNHYHFLLKSENTSISKVMGTFNKRYTYYYNRKYDHVGHVFQQRFNSKPKPFPHDLLAVSRYIHRNPINTKIPLAANMEDYPYSSYQYYKNEVNPPYPFINLHDLPASLYLPNEKTSIQYCDYVEIEEEEDILPSLDLLKK